MQHQHMCNCVQKHAVLGGLLNCIRGYARLVTNNWNYDRNSSNSDELFLKKGNIRPKNRLEISVEEFRAIHVNSVIDNIVATRHIKYSKPRFERSRFFAHTPTFLSASHTFTNKLTTSTTSQTSRRPYVTTHRRRKDTTVSHSHTNHLDLPFNKHYKLRNSIGQLVQDYAKKPVPSKILDLFADQIDPLDVNARYMLGIRTMNLVLAYTCRRIHAFETLPYLALLNPHVEHNHAVYLRSLERVLSVEYPYALHNPKSLRTVLSEFLHDQQDSIVPLARGLAEVSSDGIKGLSGFLNVHARERLILQLLGMQYLTLTQDFAHLESTERDLLKGSQIFNDMGSECSENTDSTGYRCGILNKSLPVADLINRTSELVGDLVYLQYDYRPQISITTGKDLTFPCIPTLLEYVITELLKNAFRAQCEVMADRPVTIDIIKSETQTGEPQLDIRIRDFGGGIPPESQSRVWDFAYTTFVARDDSNLVPGEPTNAIAGLGFGLPLCRAYLEVCGGQLVLQSLYGWGTDAYITLRGPSMRKPNNNRK